MLAGAYNVLPVHQTTCQLQARAKHVAAKIKHLASGQILAKKLNTSLVKLMGFVKNNNSCSRQQFRHA